MKRVLHATDFGPQSAPAFAHALRIALDARAKLYLLHVGGPDEGAHWAQFPHVREMLGRWGLLDPKKPPSAIETELGLHVAKVSFRAADARTAIVDFAVKHECDLLVLWTHDRHGLRGWLGASMAEDVARKSRAQTLFLPGDAPGFVDMASGRMDIDSALVPVGDEFNSTFALRRIEATFRVIAPRARLTFLHVGAQAPRLTDETGASFELPVVLRQGDVVETIVAAARECGARIVAMPTAGRHGLFDALRGSTTERVLREAGLPLLAAPIAG
ncbi:MAG: universal stress protein [Rhodoblastus sp.]